MTTLKARVEAIEGRETSPADRITMIIRQIVDPDHVDARVVRCVGSGQEWLRADGESDNDFTARVRSQLQCPSGIPRVLMYSD